MPRTRVFRNFTLYWRMCHEGIIMLWISHGGISCKAREPRLTNLKRTSDLYYTEITMMRVGHGGILLQQVSHGGISCKAPEQCLTNLKTTSTCIFLE